MKIVKSKELLDYINELENINELNLSISDLLFSLLGRRDITSKKEIDTLAASSHYDKHDLFIDKISDYLDIDLTIEDNQEIFDQFIAGSISKLDPKKYLDNPYYQNIKIQDIKDKDFELVWDHYDPYEVFAYLDLTCMQNYSEVNSLGYFEEPFKFIALNYKGVTWMSITPNEIETMQKAIDTVKDEVTVFGLGLGYFIYMILLKEEVSKVTVIEKDSHIVHLFKEYLLPQFKNADKLKIVVDDANSYLNKDLESDYAFIDLWHDPFDGLDFFLKFKKSEKKQSRCKFLYWLESSFYLLLRRCFISYLLECRDGLDESNYKVSKTIEDKIINTNHQKTKSLAIASKAQLDKLLEDNSLLELLLND